MVTAAGDQDDRRRHLQPPPTQVGGGGGVALRRSVFLAVTLIRCWAATCTESGWAFITLVCHRLFWWESCGFPRPPISPHSCCPRGRN